MPHFFRIHAQRIEEWLTRMGFHVTRSGYGQPGRDAGLTGTYRISVAGLRALPEGLPRGASAIQLRLGLQAAICTWDVDVLSDGAWRNLESRAISLARLVPMGFSEDGAPRWLETVASPWAMEALYQVAPPPGKRLPGKITARSGLLQRAIDGLMRDIDRLAETRQPREEWIVPDDPATNPCNCQGCALSL